MIYIVGLGPGSLELLPTKIYKLLSGEKQVFMRTEKHPVIDELKKEGVNYSTFDYLYEQEDNFDSVYDKIAHILIEKGRVSTIVYAVPGNPMVAEKSVTKLLTLADGEQVAVEVIPAMSFLEVIYNLLKIDPADGIQVIDALMMPGQLPVTGTGCIITQVYDRMVASNVKLDLMEMYPDEHQIVVIRAAGIPGEEQMAKIPLFELDRLPWIDYLTAVYVPPLRGQNINNRVPLDRLVDIMEQLRSENGCPWDIEQTQESLKRYLIEETYEVIEAIDLKDMYKVCEELGDLLLQVVFHAQIAKEKHCFEMNDVIEGICEKLIRRHPHVFGDIKVENSTEVERNWNDIKKSEKQQAGEEVKSQLSNIPVGLPALLKADKIQKKAAEVGFDWPDYTGALAKTDEELAELKEAIARKKTGEIAEETGDLLFAVVNLARFLGVDPEAALNNTINKFRSRFEYIESKSAELGKSLTDMGLQEMDLLWEEAKGPENVKKIGDLQENFPNLAGN